jgi:hypothetical protein
VDVNAAFGVSFRGLEPRSATREMTTGVAGAAEKELKQMSTRLAMKSAMLARNMTPGPAITLHEELSISPTKHANCQGMNPV